VGDEHLASSIERIARTTVPALDYIGLEVVDARPGRVRTRLPFRPGNGNHVGTAYAGVLFSFLEATGGLLVLVAFDVSRFVPIIVAGSIRYLRAVTDPVECELSLEQVERDAVHSALEQNPKHRWTLAAAAVAADGGVACEAELVYRFKTIGG